MFLKKLNLTNFRNYSKLDFEFKTPLTVLVGNNAQGKSNFLESIYFLSTTKSPKADRDEQLIKKTEEVLRVEGTVERGDGEGAVLEIAMQQIPDTNITKRVKVNGIPRRIVDYIGNLAVVTFAPEDINLVTGPPALRRWHIDLTLAQVDKEYKKTLTDYGEIVSKRNKILKAIKDGLAKLDELDFWSLQQVALGKIINKKRKDFFNYLNKTERKFGDFGYEYLESEINEDRLHHYLNREIASSSCLIGPHRDDFKFIEKSESGELRDLAHNAVRDNSNDYRDLAHFGSRGEHRTAVLDLKLSEVDFIESVSGSRPILLLDDVFSELDLAHREHVIDLISLQQTIIAAVELDGYLEAALAEGITYSVENGQLSELAEK